MLSPNICLIHDADSAAAELWASPDLNDAFYLSLSNHLGASLISERRLISGIHGHSSTIEHIQMEPGGNLCYCGKHGCMETLKTFILGGYLAPYLNESDLAFLYMEIEKLTPFPETSDFLQISKMPKHNITIGAALPYIQEFLGIR